MFRKVKSTMKWQDHIRQMPHCDQRVLHSPGECQYCDKHPEWQALRLAWGIAFTNWEPEGTELPCPANHARGDMTKGWAGNIARPEPNTTICHNSNSNGPVPQSDATGYVDPSTSDPAGYGTLKLVGDGTPKNPSLVVYDRDVVKSLERKIEEDGDNRFSRPVGYGG